MIRIVTVPVCAVLLGLACLPQAGCTRVSTEEAAPAPVEREVALPGKIHNAPDDSTLLLVAAGDFVMGPSEGEKRVSLPAFYIDRLEVTNAQYAKFLADVKKQGDAAWRHPDQPKDRKSHVPLFWSNPDLGEAKATHPVVGVSWFDAYAYAKWAGKRLPTEAEWERAARGTDGRPFPWGGEPPVQGLRYRASFFGTFLGADGFRFTAPVGSFPTGASPVACLNMAGNAAEWCADWFGPLPSPRRLESPTGPATGSLRVAKGGAWNLGAESLQSSRRWPLDPQHRLASVGFRCAMDAPKMVPEAKP